MFPIQISIILFASTFLSGLIVFINKGDNKTWLNLLLAFSGAYLFAICALHLLPEIYMANAKTSGIFLLIGFFVQIILELLSEGIEHGHIHKHNQTEKLFPIAMMIGLSIHAFLEGMPIIDFTTSSISQPLLIGIIIHNIPISIALMTVLLSANISKYKAMFWLALFAFMSPLGSVFSYILNVNFVVSLGQYYTAIMALVIGIFLHISTTILFESSDNHKFNIMKFVVIIAGAFIAYLTI